VRPESELEWFDPIVHGTASFLYWFVAVIVAGALVGLGGPFWYDAVRSLSFVLQLMKPLTQGPKAAAGTGTGEEVKTAATAPGAEPKQPTTPVAAFKAAGESEKAAPSAPIGRAPLDARGEPMRI
jgi:hypothetical protein